MPRNRIGHSAWLNPMCGRFVGLRTLYFSELSATRPASGQGLIWDESLLFPSWRQIPSCMSGAGTNSGQGLCKNDYCESIDQVLSLQGWVAKHSDGLLSEPESGYAGVLRQSESGCRDVKWRWSEACPVEKRDRQWVCLLLQCTKFTVQRTR